MCLNDTVLNLWLIFVILFYGSQSCEADRTCVGTCVQISEISWLMIALKELRNLPTLAHESSGGASPNAVKWAQWLQQPQRETSTAAPEVVCTRVIDTATYHNTLAPISLCVFLWCCRHSSLKLSCSLADDESIHCTCIHLRCHFNSLM